MVMAAADELQSDEATRSWGQGAESGEVHPETASWFARRGRMRTNLDMTLAVLVVVFAFVLASVPIRNSDVWLHLAAGRQLVSGPSSAGADPFLHTVGETPGTHATGLFDVLRYGVYLNARSFGLGLLKALARGLLTAAIFWGGVRNSGWGAAGGQ